MRVVLTVTLLSLLIITFAFDAGKFERCEQKQFCRRLRNKGIVSRYSQSGDAVLTNNELTGMLAESDANSIFNDNLQYKLTAYDKGIFRLQIHEQIKDGQTPKKRYQVKDVLVDQAKPIDIKQNGTSLQGVQDFEFVPSGAPFQYHLKYKGESVLIFNAKNKLLVENQFREKTPADSNETMKYEGETAIGFDVTWPNTEHLYGIPERSTDFALKSTLGEGITSEPYRLYNLDVYRYEIDSPLGLYGVVPMLMSMGPKGSFGIFHLNPSETFIDIYKENGDITSHWMSETGAIDLFILPGPTPKDISRQFTFLTGTTPLPQRFAIGHHQCRWNYKDEPDVRQVNDNFNLHDIPYDVLWLDIEHTDDKKYFTWHPQLFPTPLDMQANLAKYGRKMVTISDPHIKRTSGYHVHDIATSNGYYVKKAGGNEDYEGHCWPGSSSWLDFFNPKVRDWYSTLYHFDKYQGSSKTLYTWIDMNEPSVFSGPEVTMDKDAIHHGDLEHREVHNQYGFYQGMAVYKGHVDRDNGQDRPFLLTRSFFAGSQRYVAVWTGDNTADWQHLNRANSMLMSLGIGGITFVGADVGGFFDNPAEELLVRWYQAGAFYPFFRAHAEFQTKRREPWLFGEENTKLIRAAIIRRYQLISYYYTQFWHSSTSGFPILRALMFEYPTDSKTWTMQDQFLIGSDLMVKPIVTESTWSTNVYFPGVDPWYDFATGSKYEAMTTSMVSAPREKIPYFQRGGSIMAIQTRVRRSTTQMEKDPYTLQVALNNKGAAVGDLYLDDGKSFDYKKGVYTYRKFRFETNGSASILQMRTKDYKSDYPVENTIEKVVVYGIAKCPTRILLELGQDATLAVDTQATLEYTCENEVLTIRKPFISLSNAWKIKIQNV